MKLSDESAIRADTYAEIDLNVLKRNFRLIKKFSLERAGGKDVKICSIVKADAYGHGMLQAASALADAGTDYLGTADYFESIELADFLKKNKRSHTPVLCLGILNDKKLFAKVVSRNIEVSLADMKSTRMLNGFLTAQNMKVKAQIQIDSGINRTGFLMSDAFEAVMKISRMKGFELSGIYSHLATAEKANDSYARMQIGEFRSLIKELSHAGINFPLRHISNTGGILNYNDGFFNMVRPGISLYGYYPDRKYIRKSIGIGPVMTLVTTVKYIKELHGGESISYGRNYFTKSDTYIASLPIGYGDGYSRLLSNKAKVFIKGKLYPVVGAVCMDWIMTDIGKNRNIRVGDRVVVFGKEYPAYKLSEITGSIPYEITCGITRRVKRIYKG